MKIISVQPASYTDFVTEDGVELSRLPYPFHGDEEGHLINQELWQGEPERVVGFVRDPSREQIDLFWRDIRFQADPSLAIGMYVITQNSDSTMSIHTTAISGVTVRETGSVE